MTQDCDMHHLSESSILGRELTLRLILGCMPWVYSKTPYISYENNNYENQLESTILLVKQNLLVIVVSI